MLIGLVGVERQSAVGPALVTCTVAKAGGQLDPTTTSPINFTVVFSAPVTGFDGLGINFAGSTAGGPRTATVSGSGTTYNVAVTGMTTSGDIAITVNAGYTTPPNSLSTSADNTVAWIGAAGGWQTLYSKTLTADSNGWGSYSMRQVIKTAAYNPGAPATASAIRVTVDASGTSDFTADHIRAGHAPGSGDAYDYDGTQAPMLFSGGAACFVSTGTQLLSDSTAYAFDKTKDLVLSASFPGVITGVKQGDFSATEFIGGYKNTEGVDDTITTDASDYTTTAGRVYAFSKVEVFTSTGPTLQALFATRYAEADTFGAHTVTLAATQALTAVRYTGDDAFAGHTISSTGATQTLTAARYAESDAFPTTHTVGRGAVGLTATRYAEADAFGAATVTGPPTAAWHDLWVGSLTVDSAGWDNYTIALYIPPGSYDAGAPATGTKLRVTLKPAAGTGATWSKAYIGHTATSGDTIDFDGTQVAELTGGASGGTTAAGVSKLLDEVTYSFNKTKGLVFRIHITAGDVKSLTSGPTTRGYILDGADGWTGFTDVPVGGGDFSITAGSYFVEKIEVFG